MPKNYMRTVLLMMRIICVKLKEKKKRLIQGVHNVHNYLWVTNYQKQPSSVQHFILSQEYSWYLGWRKCYQSLSFHSHIWANPLAVFSNKDKSVYTKSLNSSLQRDGDGQMETAFLKDLLLPMEEVRFVFKWMDNGGLGNNVILLF